MLIVGLTGGIGSGKTLITNIFQNIGIPVYNADLNAKKLYSNAEIAKKLCKMFSSDILVNGKIDTKRLASIVFNDKAELEKLNSFVHPLVHNDFLSWIKYQNSAYVIMESALIYESGWNTDFDKIICIDTPQDLSIQRVIIRDNITKEQVEKRIENQISVKIKIQNSDYIIHNDNIQLVTPQVIDIHNKLISLAAKQEK